MDALLLFNATEYSRRVNLVREQMQARGVDLLLIHTPENLFYLTGYDTSGYFAYQCLALPLRGEPIILTRRGEAANARRSTVKERLVYFDGEDVVEKTIAMLHQFSAAKRIGLEMNSYFLSVARYQQLARHFETTKAQMVDCSLLVDQVRLVKSAPEIALIRKAAEIVDIAMAAAIRSIHVGTTENKMAAAISEAAISAGSDYTGLPHLIRTGDRCELGHAQWSQRQVERGEVVYFELSGCVQRYSAVMMRTNQVAPEDKEVRKASETVINALNAMLAAMRPGMLSGDLHDVAIDEISKAGFPPAPRRMGYSLGIGYPPGWGEWDALDLQKNGMTALKAGMVFHLVPGIVLNPRARIGFSETVLVTEQGAEVLTKFDREFKVIT